MGEINKRPPVKLIVGHIYHQENIFEKACLRLQALFGPIDFVSEKILFTLTDYYTEEMGQNLIRKFTSFEKLIEHQKLVQAKIETNQIEQELANSQGNRSINLDPGVLTAAKLILATTKNHYHRIYLDRGIYAEITLYYNQKSFKKWPWTYPDYATDQYVGIFNKLRKNYHKQIKDIGLPFI